jgi:hypothetical protein
MDMVDKQKFEVLKGLLIELESAHYGGFRASTSDDEIEALRWAVEQLGKKKYSLDELVKKCTPENRHDYID